MLLVQGKKSSKQEDSWSSLGDSRTARDGTNWDTQMIHRALWMETSDSPRSDSMIQAHRSGQ